MSKNNSKKNVTSKVTKTTKTTTAKTKTSTNKKVVVNTKNAKWIKGFEGQYKITPTGQVISYKKDKEKGAPLKARKNTSGYLSVDLRHEGSHNERYIHKLVAEHFIRNSSPKNNNQVSFKDGNRENVKSTNLVWTNRKASNEMAKARKSKSKKTKR